MNSNIEMIDIIFTTLAAIAAVLVLLVIGCCIVSIAQIDERDHEHYPFD